MRIDKLIARGFQLLAVALCWLALFGAVQAQERVLKDTSGTEFILAFQPNYYGSSTLSLFIASQEDTQGVVEIPGLGFSTSFTVQAGQVTTVTIPDAAKDLPNNRISNLGIRVTADAPVHIYGLNRQQYTTDAFLGLPVHVLGTDYRVMSYYGLIGSQLAVIGTEDGTEVTITPSASVASHPAGQPFTFTLNRQQTFQLGADGIDLTGTSITASAPVAVTSGVQCANVPRDIPWCDHIVDMVPPLTAWGKSFLTYPLAIRKRGDLFRILASRDGTELRIDGTLVATLNAGAFYDRILTTPSRIEANAPVLLAQYSVGQGYDNVSSDPFMMLVPPSEQFLNRYTFTTPASGFSAHFVNVVIPTSVVSSLRLDGAPLDPAGFKPIGDSGFSGAQLALQAGSHTIEAEQGFGIYVYGFASYDSYGYAGGMAVEVINPVHGDYRNVRVISTVATGGIDLVPASFTRAPDRIDTYSDRLEIEWRFDQFSIGQVQDLDFDLILRDPVPGEQRLVSHSLELVYEDLNGNEHRRRLGEQQVTVLPSVYRLDLALDKTSYTAGETVTILPGIANLGAVDGLVALELEVRDGAHNNVATLPVIGGIAIAAGSQINVVPNRFDTKGLYAGDYTVHARLIEQDGRRVLTASADFRITVPEGLGLTAAVTTDKPEYAPFETVSMQERIRNTAPNAMAEGLTATTTVYTPDGGVFWTGSQAVRQLVPNGWQDLAYQVPLKAASPGQYQVRLVVRDAQGAVTAQAETAITVRSTAETGAGLAGTVQVAPMPVLRSETVSIEAVVKNSGNGTVQSLPVTVSIVDPASQTVLAQWSETVGALAPTQSYRLAESWQAWGTTGATYMVVVSAAIAGETKVLAVQRFVMADKFETSLALGEHGRVLVLMDEAMPAGSVVESGQCVAIDTVELAAALAPPLASDARIVAELFDRQGVLVDSEQTTVSDFTGAVNMSQGSGDADLVITGLSAGTVAVRLSASAAAQTPLASGYTVVVTSWSGGAVQRLESGPIATDCGQSVVAGDMLGGFAVAGVTQAVDAYAAGDPHGPTGMAGPVSQRQYLEDRLQRAGWSYRIATSAAAFARELHSGDYNAYLLLSEQIKLAPDVQKELREAVYRGEGLVLAGAHDQRNQILDDISGIKYIGHLNQTLGLQLQASPLGEAGQIYFSQALQGLRVAPQGAELVGSFLAGGAPAVLRHPYGHGRTVFMGFDLLGEAAAAGAAGDALGDLLERALADVQPDMLSPLAADVVPVQFAITNLGSAASGRVRVLPPGGSAVVDPGMAEAQADGTLLWPFTLAHGETRQLAFWLRLPPAAGTAIVQAIVQTGTAPNFQDYSRVTLELGPAPAPVLATDVVDPLTALAAMDKRYRQPLTFRRQAEQALARPDPAQALGALLQAADALIGIGTAEAAGLRRSLGYVIRDVAREL